MIFFLNNEQTSGMNIPGLVSRGFLLRLRDGSSDLGEDRKSQHQPWKMRKIEVRIIQLV